MENQQGGAGKLLLAACGIVLAIILGLIFAIGGADQEQKDKAAQDCSSGAAGNDTVTVSKDAPAMIQKYAKQLEDAANTSGIPASKLAAQIETESGWNPAATSPVGAKGLTQFMPDTWKTYGEGDAFNPENSIKAQGKYMGELKRMFNSDDLAFAAYNAGPGNVQAHHGIPPFAETQKYVSQINSLAKKYDSIIKQASNDADVASAGTDEKPGESMTDRHKRQAREKEEAKAKASAGASASPSSSTSSSPASQCQNDGSGSGANKNTSGKDDYPWKNMPHCNADYTSCPSQATPLGFYPSECVDFAAWRANQEMGGDEKNIKFNNSDPHLGNAVTWLDGWKQKGWKYGKTPKKGAMVYYGANVSGASAMGHLAVVKDVSADGKTYTEEGYNGEAPPNDHKYYVHPNQPIDKPTYFLYVPDKK